MQQCIFFLKPHKTRMTSHDGQGTYRTPSHLGSCLLARRFNLLALSIDGRRRLLHACSMAAMFVYINCVRNQIRLLWLQSHDPEPGCCVDCTSTALTYAGKKNPRHFYFSSIFIDQDRACLWCCWSHTMTYHYQFTRDSWINFITFYKTVF